MESYVIGFILVAVTILIMTGAVWSTRSSPSTTPAASSNTSTVVNPVVTAVPAPVVTAVPLAERADARCGPGFDNAKCGSGRCCSIWGWCGSAGEAHCTTGINVPEFNGDNAVIV